MRSNRERSTGSSPTSWARLDTFVPFPFQLGSRRPSIYGRKQAASREGTLFRSINKAGRVWGNGMTPKVLWEIVREAASRAGIEKPAPHDLRRYAECRT